MFRSRFRKILTVIGLIVAGVISAAIATDIFLASDQHHPGYIYQPAQKSREISLPRKTVAMQGYQPFCENPQGATDSQLCAEWAGVQQAAENNRLGSLNLKLGVATLVLTIIGTWGLIWTLAETRSTSRRELRAYVLPERVGAFHVKDGKSLTLEVGGRIDIKNSGQTPAYRVRHIGCIRIADFAIENEMSADDVDLDISNPIPPGGEVHKVLRLPSPITKEQIRGLKSGPLVIYVFGKIMYQDAFGIEHTTTYRFAWKGWRIPDDMLMNFAHKGNSAD